MRAFRRLLLGQTSESKRALSLKRTPDSHEDAPPPYSLDGSFYVSNPSEEVDKDNGDDQYAWLKEFDTIFVVDDSGSMQGSRWKEARDALKEIAPICTEYDSNGVDIHFLNHKEVYRNIKVASRVMEIFSIVPPSGCTDIGKCLTSILDPYMEGYMADKKATKAINIIIITDGISTDDDQSPIVKVARELDGARAPSHQIGIQFFQVGNNSEATEHLKNLDDNLQNEYNIRDMVDTLPWKGKNHTLTGDLILKAVLGSVDRRIDDKSLDV